MAKGIPTVRGKLLGMFDQKTCRALHPCAGGSGDGGVHGEGPAEDGGTNFNLYGGACPRLDGGTNLYDGACPRLVHGGPGGIRVDVHATSSLATRRPQVAMGSQRAHKGERIDYCSRG